MTTILSVLQIAVAVLLIISILLQKSASGLGATFGDSDSIDAGYHTRRGFEKILFNFTVVLAVIFLITSLTIFLIA